MKKKFFYSVAIAALTVALSTTVCAQEIIFDPSLLEPDPEGYYIAGHIKDEVFYDSCSQEFQEFHHFEAGTQQDFAYDKCMIMPTCPSKNEPSEVSLGYIQMAKAYNLGTDTAIFGSITGPAVTNLQSYYVETSPDVTPLDTRHIYFLVEYSKDGGATWEPNAIKDETLTKNGDSHTYEAGGLFFAFDEMIAASQEGPIHLRVSSGADQRVRIHKIIITAEAHSGITPQVLYDKPFDVINNLIIAREGTVTVYNILGKLIDTGKTVYVNEGIYIVRTADGNTHKVCIRPL